LGPLETGACWRINGALGAPPRTLRATSSPHLERPSHPFRRAMGPASAGTPTLKGVCATGCLKADTRLIPP
jgi:hypothetical protein